MEPTRTRGRDALWLPLSVVVGSAMLRLIPHPPNFTPVLAMALFAGASFSSRWMAILAPLAAMALSDVALQALGAHGFHSQMISVYVSVLAITLLGEALGTANRRVLRVGLAAVLASTLFYVVTNFSVWLMEPMYPKTGAGLVACYVAAIPFYGLTALGTVFYAAILFGIDAVAHRTLVASQKAC